MDGSLGDLEGQSVDGTREGKVGDDCDDGDMAAPPVAAPPVAGSAAAWLAEWGMVALLPVEEPTAIGEPDEAVAIRRSAQKVWAEGRVNPVWYECRTWIGDWKTDDRVTWRTADRVWLAQLQRSPNGRRVYLRFWRGQTFVGDQDDGGWHPVSARARARPPRAVQRSLRLPLAG
jgi:hypothetical protein